MMELSIPYDVINDTRTYLLFFEAVGKVNSTTFEHMTYRTCRLMSAKIVKGLAVLKFIEISEVDTWFFLNEKQYPLYHEYDFNTLIKDTAK